MGVRQIIDRQEIYDFLSTDQCLYLYEIGDLDDFFWPYTQWWGYYSRNQLIAVALIYQGEQIPIILVMNGTLPTATLLENILGLLPDKIYCHSHLAHLPILEKYFHLSSHGKHLRMQLENWHAPSPPKDRQLTLRLLKISDLHRAQQLYTQAYPDHWFNARMLETGKYLGAFSHGDLIGIAGIHVFSETYKVASLGNIATHPGYRGRGIAKYLTWKLCHCLASHVDTIGLNVKADNFAAIHLYKQVGFSAYTEFEETMMDKKPGIKAET